LGAVNTITFVDENRRFVTTSDDKTLRVWEYDIPVVIKYIAEPSMHAIPSVAVHPNGNSNNNNIYIYKIIKKKNIFSLRNYIYIYIYIFNMFIFLLY